MNKIFLTLLIVTAFVWTIQAGHVRAEDAAMVVDVQGTARYESGSGSDRKVALMDFLAEGDRLNLEAGCTLILNYFSSGNREILTGPGLLTVGLSASTVETSLKMETTKLAFQPKAAVLSQEDGQQAGAIVLRSANAPTVRPSMKTVSWDNLKDRKAVYLSECIGSGKIAPDSLFLTAVSGLRPQMRWKPVEGAQEYEIRVLDDQGRSMVETSTKENAYAYAGADLIRGRRYKWSVTALAGDRTIAQGGGEFRVLSESQLKSLSAAEKDISKVSGRDTVESRVSITLLYQEYQLYDEAAAAVNNLLRDYPDNVNLARRLDLLAPGVTW